MIPGIIAGHTIAGSGPVSSLYDLIIADSPAYYFRMAEASGSVMENEVGTDGTFSNVTHAKSALYSGGPTCTQVPATGSPTGLAALYSGSLPSMTEVSIGMVCKFSAISSIRGLISCDNGAGNRRWQFRTNGTGIDWVKIAGGIQTVSYAAGLTTGVSRLIGVEIKDSGTPGVSDIAFYINGVAVYTSTLNSVNYGSAGSFIEIGSCSGAGGAYSYADFSECFIIPNSIGASRWAEYADSAGL